MSTESEAVAKVIRAFKKELDELAKENIKLVRRIQALEESNLWNVLQGKIEPSPHMERTIRTASGEIAFKQPIGEVVNDAD